MYSSTRIGVKLPREEYRFFAGILALVVGVDFCLSEMTFIRSFK